MNAMLAVEEWTLGWGDDDERPSVLVVDDYDGMRVLLGVMLQRLGFEPVTVGSAGEALEALDDGPFVAVVSDFCMPGGSGLELLRRLRARGDQVPFVLMSAGLSAEAAADALRAGATLALAKQDLVESLPRVLQRALSGPSRRSAGSPSRRARSRPSPTLVTRMR